MFESAQGTARQSRRMSQSRNINASRIFDRLNHGHDRQQPADADHSDDDDMIDAGRIGGVDIAEVAEEAGVADAARETPRRGEPAPARDWIASPAQQRRQQHATDQVIIHHALNEGVDFARVDVLALSAGSVAFIGQNGVYMALTS